MPEFWEDVPEVGRVTLLNLQAFPESERIHSVCYDGGRFPFADGEFDIIFSNSTLEHVIGPENQKFFTAEVRRVGKGYSGTRSVFFFVLIAVIAVLISREIGFQHRILFIMLLIAVFLLAGGMLRNRHPIERRRSVKYFQSPA